MTYRTLNRFLYDHCLLDVRFSVSGDTVLESVRKKSSARVTLLVGLLACLLLPAPMWADPPKPGTTAKCILTLDPEIDCPSCEDGIKRVLATAHGVESANVDVLNNRITVHYDPTRINVKALIGRIFVTGYTATEVR